MQNNAKDNHIQETGNPIIEILSSGMLLQSWKIPESDVVSFVILSSDSTKGVRKFTTCSTRIIGNNNYFQNSGQFEKFMSNEQNFSCRVNDSNDLVILQMNWKVTAHNYEAVHRVQIELHEQTLDQRKQVEYQNKILRKQLQYYKNKSVIKTKTDQKIAPINSIKHINQIVMVKKQQSDDDRTIVKDSNSELAVPFRIVRNTKAILLKDRIQQIKNQLINNGKKAKQSKSEKQSKNKKIQKQVKNKNKKTNQKTKKSNKVNNEQACQTQSRVFSEKQSQKCIRSQQQNNKSYTGTQLPQQKKRRYLHSNTFQIEYVNGNIYRGELKDNKFHGKGIYFQKNCRFQGTWVQGETDGEGICYFKNGVVEKGTYRPGFRRFGPGQDLYENGEMYTGEFANEKKNGFGRYSFANGESYEGEWKDDLQHGKGIQYLNNDQRFQGTWVDDQRHGPGVLITKTGQTKQIWANGKLVKQFVTLDQ